MALELTIQDIVHRAKTYLPDCSEDRLFRAYSFADEAHAGQKRFSGEPFLIHPLSVANLLLQFQPDENTLIAALLHDVAEDTTRTLDEIEKVFGQEVRNLCWGMMKLSKVRSKLNDPQIENLRKLFLAMVKDFRVVMIKLCDRLHNMQTLGFVRPEKKERIAQETLNIYAPIAARLGIYRLKSQLEDLCFQYLNPDGYQNIQQQLVKSGKWREKYIETAKKILSETIAREGIQARIDGRVKSAYSIYRKLKKKNKNSLQDVFDVFAMRIILPDIYKYGNEYTGHLYTALGVIHNNFTPLANRFKDYIAVPKVNGYRSLHTTVMGLGPKTYAQPTEIQIRSETMHQSAEFGIAAHWIYKDGVENFSEHYYSKQSGSVVDEDEFDDNSSDSLLRKQKNWISGLGEIEKEIKGNQELLENLKNDTFQDRIFILTPRGDVKDLPVGATPIDFAYSVHTGIGNTCIAARVNGNMVPLDHELKNGEVVEIVIRKNAKPSHRWLSFVKTNHARNRIRGWFRNLDEGKHLRVGKELLNEKLNQFGKPSLDFNLSILKEYDGNKLSLRQREELLIEMGKGAILPGSVIRKIFNLEELLGSKYEPRTARPLPAPPVKSNETADSKEQDGLFIGGEKNMPYHFVKCCNAHLEGELLGYVTRGRGVSVHRKNCKVLHNIEASRLINVGVLGKKTYPVRIIIELDDRIGLIRDISQVIVENSINILDLVYQENGNGAHPTVNIVLEIQNFDQLERVLGKIEKIPNVRRAFKLN